MERSVPGSVPSEVVDSALPVGTRVSFDLSDLGRVPEGTVVDQLDPVHLLVWWDHAALTVVDLRTEGFGPLQG